MATVLQTTFQILLKENFDIKTLRKFVPQSPIGY